MKKIFSCLTNLCFILFALHGYAQNITVTSPDKQLQVSLLVADGKPAYSVTYMSKTMLENSPLGLNTNEGDFSTGMKYISKTEEAVNKTYTPGKD